MNNHLHNMYICEASFQTQNRLHGNDNALLAGAQTRLSSWPRLITGGQGYPGNLDHIYCSQVKGLDQSDHHPLID